MEGQVIIIGYGLISFILIMAATTFETQTKAHLPIRVILFLIALMLLLVIPASLDNIIKANDAVNKGNLNVTQVNNLIKLNDTVMIAIAWLPFILLAWLFFYYFFFRFREEITEEGKREWRNLESGKGSGWHTGKKRYNKKGW